MLVKLTSISLILLFSGCVSLPKAVKSNLEGACLRSVHSMHMLETRASLYKSERLLSPKPAHGKHGKSIGLIEVGTSFSVERVLGAEDGSWGKFLRVQVKVLDGEFSGVIADVPVHAPYHPSGKWTKNFTLDPNALEFNEEIVVPCD